MKNKKVLAFLALPLIISIMVLPLCSWVESPGSRDDMILYSSRTPIDLGFYYSFEGDFDIYGYLTNVNSFLRNTEYDDLEDSINSLCYFNFYNGDISYIPPWTESNLVSDYSLGSGFINASQVLGCYNEHCLTGEILIDSFFEFSYLDNLYLSFYRYDGYIDDLDYYTLMNMENIPYDIDITYFSPASGNFFDKHYYAGDIHLLQNGNMSLGEFISYVASYYNDSTFSYVSYFRLTPRTNIGADRIRIVDKLYEVRDVPYGDLLPSFITLYRDGYSNGIDDGYDYGYEQGYFDALNTGHTPPSLNEFSSLGKFLVKSVGAFTDFEIVPNVISIGDVLAIFVGGTLIIAFLKIFAGG